jgi:diadenosine tetraphosphate (Ap4A) HIT family hydrolase
VKDSGVGIPEPEQKEIFARYGRASSARGVGGLGLGPYLVCEIVKEHGSTGLETARAHRDARTTGRRGTLASMSNPSMAPTCAVCASLSGRGRLEPVFENDLWHVRPASSPPGVPGWMMMIARRHVAGPAHFDEREAKTFGPALRHFERVLEEVTGALRIYTAAMGESSPHFHAHMVPRYAAMPREAKGWGVFDLERAAKAGEIPVDLREVDRVTEAYRRALAEMPLVCS